MAPMKVLIAHNRYLQAGGEDAVMEDEVALLREYGHEVVTLERHNKSIADNPISSGLATLWSTDAARELQTLCRSFRPDVIHCHNTFPQLSPAIYWAAARERVPVVQTLHNFRLLCANAMLTRHGQPCEQCVGTLPWRGVLNRCYRDSTSQSLMLVGMLGLHRAIGSFQHKVTRYIALNKYCRDKFIAGGLPADRFCIKPNFAPDPKPTDLPRSGLLFVGRLSPEKGVQVLLDAASLAQQRVTVVGDGPLADQCRNHPWIDYRGAIPRAEVMQAMQTASCLIVPSTWYENMPRTVVEAFACGLPVIASRLGALAEMVSDGCTGMLFDAGDAPSLARCVRDALQEPQKLLRWGQAARETYLQNYTAEASYAQLMSIYREAVAATSAGAAAP